MQTQSRYVPRRLTVLIFDTYHAGYLVQGRIALGDDLDSLEQPIIKIDQILLSFPMLGSRIRHRVHIILVLSQLIVEFITGYLHPLSEISVYFEEVHKTLIWICLASAEREAEI